MKYLVVTALGLVLLILAIIVSLPYMAGGEFITAQLQQAVSRQTGRTLTLLKAPQVTLLPDAAVVVEGAALSNPADMGDGSTVSIERLEAKISFWQFFSRSAEIKEVVLVRPRVTLLSDAQGRANWELPQDNTAGAVDTGGSSATQVTVAPVRIVDGELIYNDERTGASFSATAINATVQLPISDMPLKADGSLRWNRELVNLKLFIKDVDRLAGEGSPVELALDARLMQAAVSGRARLGNGFDLDGQADMSAPDLRKLAGWAGWQASDGPGLRDFTAKGALSMAGGRVTLQDARLGMDGMSANGLLRVATGGDKPQVEASLGVNRIDLNTYAPPPPDASTRTAEKGSAGWSDAQLDFSGLGLADATLRLRAGEIVYRKMTFKDSSLDAGLRNGKLDAKLNSLELYGGKASGELVIDGSQNLPRIAGKLSASGADARPMLEHLAGLKALSGKADVKLDLSATGRSQREMASTLRGSAGFELGEGVIDGIDLAGTINAVRSSILDGWKSAGSGSTQLDRLAARFDLSDGIGEVRQLDVEAAGIVLAGQGSADVLRQRLDLKLSPRLKQAADGEEAMLPVPVVISGPWNDPRIYPDVEGILEDPQSAFDTLGKLGVNVEAAGQTLRSEAEKVLGKKGAKQAEDLINNLLNQQD